MIYRKKILFKIIIILISFILFFTFINSLFSNDVCMAENINTLYVGGIGKGNYTFIQDAINNSIVNDTIFVFKGIYNESIFIDKPLNLIGFDKNSTIIQTNKSLYNIFIKSSNVNITNFTIKNGKMGIYVSDINYSYNTISGNIFLENYEGIRLYKSSNNQITKNYFFNNLDYGIISYESKNNKIYENFIKENSRAFYFYRWSNNNIISKNNFSNNNICIYFSNSYNNLITNNSFWNGLIAIHLSSSNNNNLSFNKIDFFDKYGIQLTDSEENIIISNNFSNNYIDIKEVEKPPSVKAPGLHFVILIIAIFIVFSLKSKK